MNAAAPSGFDALLDPAARAATAPLLALALGVVLYLLCELSDRLRPARALVFLAAIGAALAGEVRILLQERVPGAVLDGTLIADRATAAWGVLFLLATLLAWVYSIGYYREDRPFEGEHDALMLCATAGMMLMIGAGDLIVFFVGLETLSIPLYALAAFRRARSESVEAGVKYFLLGSFASALFLYGVALVYAATGTVDIGELLERDLSSKLALSGLALFAASLFFKVSVFPFHLWVPDVYQGSPTPVTALMATGTKAAAFGFLVIQATPLLPRSGASLVALLALVTMALGNLGALLQSDLKRMFAYSAVAHAGTLLLLVAAGMAGGDALGSSTVRAAFYYLGGYLFTATGTFGLISLLESDGERFTRLESLRGLARPRPYAAFALALFMLSLGGIPATAGFLGKWFVFSALVEADMVLWAVLGALLSVVALAYYLRVIVVIFMQAASEGDVPPTTQRPWTAGIATAVCGIFVIAMGLFPSFFLALLAP
jgi:NADH-quinone oxidoreductase subunit N